MFFDHFKIHIIDDFLQWINDNAFDDLFLMVCLETWPNYDFYWTPLSIDTISSIENRNRSIRTYIRYMAMMLDENRYVLTIGTPNSDTFNLLKLTYDTANANRSLISNFYLDHEFSMMDDIVSVEDLGK